MDSLISWTDEKLPRIQGISSFDGMRSGTPGNEISARTGWV